MKLNELEIKIQISSEEHFRSICDSCIELFDAPISRLLQLDEYYSRLEVILCLFYPILQAAFVKFSF